MSIHHAPLWTGSITEMIGRGSIPICLIREGDDDELEDGDEEQELLLWNDIF